MSSTTAVIDSRILKEAAAWAITFQYESPSVADRQALELWCRKSPAHAAAWMRTQAIFHVFDEVPREIGAEALESLQRSNGRRRSLRTVGMLLVVAPLGMLALRYVPWREWTADVSTTAGERKQLTLPDESHLALNTRSAVNIKFSDTERRIRLVAGEVLISTQKDRVATPRPFLLDTPAGVVRALGTRFNVRQIDSDRFRVAVLESAVEIRPFGGTLRIVREGEQAEFDGTGVGSIARIENHVGLWEKGILLVKGMRLADVIAEIARYRAGVLRCDPAVADLRVSGSLPIGDTDAALAVLAESLPLKIESRSKYWVTVLARD